MNMTDLKPGSLVSILTWLYYQKVSIGHLLCFLHNLLSNGQGRLLIRKRHKTNHPSLSNAFTFSISDTDRGTDLHCGQI